ncbi:vWA domain-containing protein [Treponema putidum]|uniref:VWA domain-containing protein n=1 Tax=Treponema putidum TaxID=221027 RepID=A0AAE9MUN6_9SPIR|nr:VWA domain-containing protein [Treponema putidum]AIN94234.1 aerotolerance regulator BatB [Treponema putidum]TWI79704.1 Ca-activated chloride channel family protein [Treponema putidum]UTY30689.1 VWA domain-containing protein [Treponema putidum]UTY33101.1 VWA domain-containing protein [Treponema putidum]
MISFENPAYLFLIIFLLPVWFIFYINLKKIKKAYLSLENLKKIIKKAKTRALFFSLAWIFLVLGLACPLWGAKPISVRRRGVSVMLVSDISKSMSLQDIQPSRIAVQRKFLKILLEKMHKTSAGNTGHTEPAVGLVITKGDGVLSVPLSFEKNALSSAIDALSPLILSSAGTNLEAGVLRALDSFGENRGNSKIIILCTDGGETTGSLLHAAEKIKKTDVLLIIVGFGTLEDSKIRVVDEKGNTQLKDARLEEEFLQKAAKAAGGDSMYISALSSGSIESILKIIDTGIEGVEKMVYIQEPVKRNFEMLLLAFIFLCLGGVSIYGKNK